MSRNKYTLQDLQNFAESQDGKLISKKYAKARDFFEWTCSNNHTFEMRWDTITNNYIKKTRSRKTDIWCPICANPSITTLREEAKKRDGGCLSDIYYRNLDLYKWRCEVGHIWKCSWANIRSGTWCPKCPRLKYSISDLQKHAKDRGGKCLSEEYLGWKKHHLWKCKFDHRWKSTWHNIKTGGLWCPYCLYKSEQMCREILEDIYSHPSFDFQKCRPKFLQLSNHYRSRLELDGYNEELKLAFEYQGLQHYQYIPYFHKNGPSDLEKQQERDKIKKERCAENEVYLIEIPCKYTHENPQELRSFIVDALVERERILVPELWDGTFDSSF